MIWLWNLIFQSQWSMKLGVLESVILLSFFFQLSEQYKGTDGHFPKYMIPCDETWMTEDKG